MSNGKGKNSIFENSLEKGINSITVNIPNESNEANADNFSNDVNIYDDLDLEENKNSDTKSDGEISDDEKSQPEDDGEDLPEGFFDDFSDQDFLAGLDIIYDAVDEETGEVVNDSKTDLEDKKDEKTYECNQNKNSRESYCRKRKFFGENNGPTKKREVHNGTKNSHQTKNSKKSRSSNKTNNNSSRGKSLFNRSRSSHGRSRRSSLSPNEKPYSPQHSNRSSSKQHNSMNKRSCSPDFEKELMEYVKKRNSTKIKSDENQFTEHINKHQTKQRNNFIPQNSRNNLNKNKKNKQNRRFTNRNQNNNQKMNTVNIPNFQNLQLSDISSLLIAIKAKYDAALLRGMSPNVVLEPYELYLLQLLNIRPQLQLNLNQLISPNLNPALINLISHLNTSGVHPGTSVMSQQLIPSTVRSFQAPFVSMGAPTPFSPQMPMFLQPNQKLPAQNGQIINWLLALLTQRNN